MKTKQKINWQNNEMAKIDLATGCPTIESADEALEIIQSYLLDEGWYGDGNADQIRYQMVDAILSTHSKKYNKEMREYTKWQNAKRDAEMTAQAFSNTVKAVTEEIRKKHEDQ